MNEKFNPDYRRIESAALNIEGQLPLYEHNISSIVAGKILNKDLQALYAEGDESSLREYFRIYAGFHIKYGYDTYSFEGCITELIQQGEGLTGQGISLIRSEEDFNAWPWEELPVRYFKRFGPMFDAVSATLPPGMKIVGGIGNGMFETVQDFIPFTELCYLEIDNPGLFSKLWKKVEEVFITIWTIFLQRYSDILAAGRFGDDLGFKVSTLLNPRTIREFVIPAYTGIIRLIHTGKKPFLLHSCGAIFEVMDDLITKAGIDAKHSNEDAIAPMKTWLETYGDRIGNFGGIDMDVLCREDEAGIREYVRERCAEISEYRGTAIGSGNQIADYVPPENFLAMVETVREFRGF